MREEFEINLSEALNADTDDDLKSAVENAIYENALELPVRTQYGGRVEISNVKISNIVSTSAEITLTATVDFDEIVPTACADYPQRAPGAVLLNFQIDRVDGRAVALCDDFFSRSEDW